MVKEPLGPDISRIMDSLYISAWPEGEHADEIQALATAEEWLTQHREDEEGPDA